MQKVQLRSTEGHLIYLNGSEKLSWGKHHMRFILKPEHKLTRLKRKRGDSDKRKKEHKHKIMRQHETVKQSNKIVIKLGHKTEASW